MSEHLRPTGRSLSVDQAIDGNLDGVSFQNYQFQRLVAVNKRFVNCDFSYSQFESVYLRGCTFDSCKFIGCKFTNSNLRSSHFVGCVFDYTEFSQTQVEPDVLEAGLPGLENMQQKFVRSLRVNFRQIGDINSENKAIKAELLATHAHLRKAWKSHESYYRKKYKGFDRLRVFIEWATFSFMDFYWGNGESIWKLLRFLILVLVAISIGDVLLLGEPSMLHGYLAAGSRSCEVLFGILKPHGYNGIVLSLIALLRYIMLACLVSIIIKRFSRR